MRSCHAIASRIILGAVLASLSAVGTAHAGNELNTYAVEHFRGSSRGECDASRIYFSEEQVDNYAKAFQEWASRGDWDRVDQYTEAEVDGRDFTDSSADDYTGDGSCSCSGCECRGEDSNSPYGADSADVAIIRPASPSAPPEREARSNSQSRPRGKSNATWLPGTSW